jgi:ATP-dependent RNA helicase RhlE
MSELRFEDLGLAAPIQTALSEKGYTVPTPIQAKAIPVIMARRDLLACAQTGTGKTAAFALPTLHHIATDGRKPFRRGVRNLILTPTRELAVQVTESFRTYGKHMDFKIGMLYGGVSQTPQTKELYFGLDVLVATTGRLLDLIRQGHANLSGVECLILDEADRMLAMGFIDDIREIAKELPKEHQTLLFSATMAKGISKLAGTLLNDPEQIRIAPQGTTAEKIDQRVNFLQHRDKQARLLDILHAQYFEQPKTLSLVFTRTKRDAHYLAIKLNSEGMLADSIHGNKTQAAREAALTRFKNGQTPILVATDVAARGIDVKNIALVINYDLPMDAENYVHRIGRTARAGESGHAVSLCSGQGEDISRLRAIERLIKQTVFVETEHDFHDEAIAELHRSGAPVPNPKRGGDRNDHHEQHREDERPLARSASRAAAPKGSGKKKRGAPDTADAEKPRRKPFRGMGRSR